MTRKWHIRLKTTLIMATLVLGAIVVVSGNALITGEAPGGARDLQSAETPARAAEILKSWDARKRLGAAVKNIRWDFGFIAAYVALLVYASWRLRSALSGWWRKASWLALVAAVVAGVCDVVENVGILGLLTAYSADSAAPLSAQATAMIEHMADVKWKSVFVCVVAVIVLDVRRYALLPPEAKLI
jgi:hypothetical protein